MNRVRSPTPSACCLPVPSRPWLRSGRVVASAAVALSAALLLSACHEGSGREAEGFLLAHGYTHPSAHMTDGSYEDHDDRACDGRATLYAFVADKAAGLVCAEDGRVWFVATSEGVAVKPDDTREGSNIGAADGGRPNPKASPSPRKKDIP
jgi:hypothetical protein